MPRKPKPAQAWTNDDALRKLFPKEVRAKVRREGRKAAESQGKNASKDDPT